MKRLLLWLRIVRPQTLFASACPVLTALIVSVHGINLVGAITLICALSLQILSNLINDYYDYRRGADKQGRQGFKRALAEGEVSEKQMLTACCIALSISVLTGLYLVYTGGLPILLIGVSAIIFAWLYTATSHSLSYLGIADIFVLLYYGILATMGTQYLQWGYFHTHYLHLGIVHGLISMCILMINNLRDIEDDRAVGKRTLPVRFGKRAAEVIMGVVILLIPFMAWICYSWSLPVLVGIPAIGMYIAVLRAKGAEYNKCLLMASLTNLIFTLLVAFRGLVPIG